MLAGRKLDFVSLPLIEITFPKGNFICLVDSGADFCYLPAVIGEALSIDIRKGEKKGGKGITGRPFEAYFHTIEFKIGGWEYKAKIGFSYELGVPFGILGREGFFSLFKKVCFNHRKEEIELTPYI